MALASLMTQTATRWTEASRSGYNVVTYTRSSFACRWQRTHEVFVDDVTNERFLGIGVVYTEQTLAYGDFLYEGSSSATSPPSDAYKVRKIERSQTPTGDIVLWKVTLG